MFDSLMAFDQPFNQAPSLHLGIGAILWVRYSANLSGAGRMLVRAWLILTGISTLTTYQHHFIDLPTGVLAGVLAIGLFPMEPKRARRLSAAYLSGSLLLAVAALRPGGLNRILLWPACALLVPAAAYATRRPALFGKRNAAMTFTPRAVPCGCVAELATRPRKPALQHVVAGGGLDWPGSGEIAV